jgi:hypothetical protein
MKQNRADRMNACRVARLTVVVLQGRSTLRPCNYIYIPNNLFI